MAGKPKTLRGITDPVIWVRAVVLIVFSIILILPAEADPTIPGLYQSWKGLEAPSPKALPQVREVVQGVSGLERPSKKRLVVHQDQEKAVIDWKSFDIGEDASTHFDQKQHTDWAALNRIYDQNPSQIYGKLTADGQLFLINRNGILFAPGSQVNVHSLVASSLNMDPDDFIAGRLTFKTDPDIPSGPVSNQGTIETTGDFGSVLLLAPEVENGGRIAAPRGRVVLAAGDKVEVTRTEEGNLSVSADSSNETTPGTARNMETGQIAADQGWIGMFGKVVNQEGIVRAVTAVKRGGTIVLSAKDKVTTGEKSRTETPVSTSSEAVHESFRQTKGDIQVSAGRLVEHRGVIEAPSGNVTLTAGERVFLEKGSRIDVGGNWVDEPAERNLVTAQLNSVELADVYGQKGGVLRGETIQATAQTGSSIGDISGNVTQEQLNAMERSVTGGTVKVYVESGDFIMKEGASIDFSGGGFRFGAGNVETTQLLAGEWIYDISRAPEWVRYDKVLGSYEKKHERYGITDTYKGVYYGGGTPLMNYTAGFDQGANAGSLFVYAKTATLDGTLMAQATRGLYQTLEEKVSGLRGGQVPNGGTLQIGDTAGAITDWTEAIDQNMVTGDIVLTGRAEPLPEAFGPEDPGPDGTRLDSSKINAAGLGTLRLYTNTRLDVEDTARIELEPGAEFGALARRIENHGEIDVPAGLINLSLVDNKTSFEIDPKTDNSNPFFVPLQEGVHLAGGSILSTAGQRTDNSLSDDGVDVPLSFGLREGGGIALLDKLNAPDAVESAAVVVDPGAVLDVSGGYEIDPTGTVTGGNAGSLNVQGRTVVLGGELRGHSLPGYEGGRIVLSAPEIQVTRFAPVSTLFNKGKLVLSGDRFAETGFAHIELKALHDLTVRNGARLSPSLVKARPPVPGEALSENPQVQNRFATRASGDPGLGPWVEETSEHIGPSSIRLNAGVKLVGVIAKPDSKAVIFVDSGTSLHVAPSGEITLSAPGVEVGGELEALSGAIQVEATQTDLVLREGSRLSAKGYNRPLLESPADHVPTAFEPEPAGSVTLQTSNGSLLMASGSVIDVCGSDPVRRVFPATDGTLTELLLAGDPGSLDVEFFKELQLDGDLLAHAGLARIQGGALTVGTDSPTAGLVLDSEKIKGYQESGFDDLTFRSLTSLQFPSPMDLQVGRRLTLDAPEILGTEGEISASAPWIRVQNSRADSSAVPEKALDGDAILDLTGDFIDLDGSLVLSGFNEIGFHARQDLRLSDRVYGVNNKAYEGMLNLPEGTVTLQAARIYPMIRSDFTIRSQGTIRTLSSDRPVSVPVVSAGGRLVLEAEQIEHRGTLAAPMGQIALRGPEALPAERIYLDEGSTITTAGETSALYGGLDENGFWTLEDKGHPGNSNYNIPVEEEPEKTVEINGREVITRKGADIDVSGGGTVFSYHFLPGTDGTRDPLKKEGRFVIVPDNSIVLPGDAVHLAGGNGLAEGTYSRLPEGFAFLPGALIVENLDTDVIPGNPAVTEEGYRITAGYPTVTGTEIRSPRRTAYSVRPAADVLKEGTFLVQEMEAGAGGRVTMDAETNILNGTIQGDALPGFLGGTVAFNGKEITLGSGIDLASNEIDFDTILPESLVGKMYLDPKAFADTGLSEVVIGDPDTTRTITLDGAKIRSVSALSLAASDAILLESGSEIHATGTEGTVRLLSPGGTVTVGERAVVHASHDLMLDAKELNLAGELQVDNSQLNLASDRIFVLPDDPGSGMPDGLNLTPALWGSFDGIEKIELTARSGIEFLGGMEIHAPGKLVIDTPSLAAPGSQGDIQVTLSSRDVTLKNSGDPSPDPVSSGTAGFTLKALDELTVGEGEIQFDGFGRIELAAGKDLVLSGAGAIQTEADLNLTAARVTTRSRTIEDEEGATRLENTDFRIDAGSGSVNIGFNGNEPGGTSTAGGSLEILARSVVNRGILEAPSGRIRLASTGSGPEDGVLLGQGSRILARGGAYTETLSTGDTISLGAPGGTVALEAPAGSVRLEAGSLIDVSASGGEDAGTIDLIAPAGGVTIDGSLEGHSDSGRGGSVSVDTTDAQDLPALLAEFTNGGFTEEEALRFRKGDVSVSGAIRTQDLKLVADQGNLELRGTIDASGPEGGGRVMLAAGADLNLVQGSRILAQGADAGTPGGEVELSTVQGSLSLAPGAEIDVSGGSGSTGGTVMFRTARTDQDKDGSDDGIALDLRGVITGPSRVTAEVVKTYGEADLQSPGHLTTADWKPWKDETGSFMGLAPSIGMQLLSGLTRNRWEEPDQLHLVPGIEVRTTQDLTLDSRWDLTSWRFHGEPGVLTLRAAGDLKIGKDLVDHPSVNRNDLTSGANPDSWGLNLIAGADLDSADQLATLSGLGTLTVLDNTSVYTESGALVFASGADTVLGSAKGSNFSFGLPILYSLGTNLSTYDGEIEGRVSRDLRLEGGVIQSAKGDIGVAVGKDVSMTNKGIFSPAIRTTGELPVDAQPREVWRHSGGGNVALKAGGSIDTFLIGSAWDAVNMYPEPNGNIVKHWSADYNPIGMTAGLAAMAGGDLTIRSGGDFNAQAGTFGKGDLWIEAGGDLDGRFLVKEGKADLVALGNFGCNTEDLQIEAFDAEIGIGAQGTVEVGTVLNPTFVRKGFSDYPTSGELQYTPDGQVTLASLAGDVSLSGEIGITNYAFSQSAPKRARILPPTLEVLAYGDIRLTNSFVLAPALQGNLRLIAGRDIDGRYTTSDDVQKASVNISDMDPYTVYSGPISNREAELIEPIFLSTTHADHPVHTGGPNTVEVRAGRNIKDLSLGLPKQAGIEAGRDILDISYDGQNLSSGDRSIIRAGRDLLLGSNPETGNGTKILQGGAGSLLVQAGRDLDLGTSEGIKSSGNLLNSALPADRGSTVTVIAGFPGTLPEERLSIFFDQLREAGMAYSEILDTQGRDAAESLVEAARKTIISPFLGEWDGSRDSIRMTSSQISTIGGRDDLLIVAAGNVNVGRSTFFSGGSAVGLFTAAGGNIDLFCGGDLNVNESKLMTYMGGNITVWSDGGDINAGRGSKTAIQAEAPKLTYVEGVPVLVFQPPAVGSGIRTLTFDPDGEEGPIPKPLAGDVYLFAPRGIIDAGEAGIAATNLVLGATDVLNAENISFSVGSVGVPAASDSAGGLGALAGVSNLGETTRLAEQTSPLRNTEERLGPGGQSLAEAFAPKWLKVEFIGFDESYGE